MAMTLRLTPAEDKALTEAAAREHKSKQELARCAILEYTSGRTKLRDSLLTRIVEEDREVLDRLADA